MNPARSPARLRCPLPPAPHLINRQIPRLEAPPGAAQVEPPHPDPLRAGDADGLVEMLVQAAGPVTQSLHVIAPEPFHVLGDEPGPLARSPPLPPTACTSPDKSTDTPTRSSAGRRAGRAATPGPAPGRRCGWPGRDARPGGGPSDAESPRNRAGTLPRAR